MSETRDDGFVSRWSRRKALARQGPLPAEPAPEQNKATPPDAAPSVAAPTAPPTAALPAPQAPLASTQAASPAAEPEPPPTLTDVAQLTRESDFRRFVAPDVDPAVKNAALKKLFGDPRFNVMDGLDVYIDDYSRPDPLPAASLRKMAQAAFLGLLDTEAEAPSAAPAEPTAMPLGSAEAAAKPPGALPCAPEPDENADLRLQPHDAARCAGPEPGAAADGTGEP